MRGRVLCRSNGCGTSGNSPPSAPSTQAQLLVTVIGAAEDEPVTQQLLQRLAEGIVARQHLALSPFGVGLVLFGQVRSGHFQRRGSVLGAIDFARIGQYPRKGLPQTRQLRAV